jgi:Holliday junction resolvase
MKEGSRAPRNIMKALSKMGNLAKVIEGRSSGTKSGADFVGVIAEEGCPFSYKLAHNKMT